MADKGFQSGRLPLEGRKAEFFQTILEIVADRGVTGVSTAEVARRLGVTQPAIYRHFKSRDEMLYFFVEVLSDQLGSIMTEAKTESNPAAQLDSLFAAHFEMVRNHPALPGIVLSDVIHGAPTTLKRLLSRTVLGYRSGIQEILQDGMDRGLFRMLDTNVMAHMILGAILSSSMVYSLGQASDPDDKERFRNTLRQILTDGAR